MAICMDEHAGVGFCQGQLCRDSCVGGEGAHRCDVLVAPLQVSCNRWCCRSFRTCSKRRSAPSACRTHCTSARLRAHLLVSIAVQAPNLLHCPLLEIPQFEERELVPSSVRRSTSSTLRKVIVRP